MAFSTTEENYIKAIYHLQLQHGKVSTNLLSEEIQTKPASVTDMLKKLQTKKVINYKPYRSFDLTEAGNKTALEIIRKHRLWEYFLVNVLGFGWDEVHSVAEQLEHIESAELTDRLDKFLGRPAFDPHGDPIPDTKGKIKTVKRCSLSMMEINKATSVCSISNQSPELLSMLSHYSIRIGTKIKVSRRFDYDGSLEVIIENKPAVIFSLQLANTIHCLL